ncbi:MAG: T9SS type A sorting domain-containing protein [Ignavibacteria bacterium]|jgi:protocatechuate 3,4-dioxygenase beta subunit|nr:T9SS type A sorting domain-containing protein [Ignavibacteria bacterium]MCU7522303.1 T9SS type A sorting domain-containing protein [Ignavibacteria bacterium]
MKRLHVFAMLIMACFWVLSGLVQAQTTYYCIGNLVWNDLNKNGIQDPGEPGIPDVTVTLYGCPSVTSPISASELQNTQSTKLAETKTDLNGNYSFGGLPAGLYFVKVTLPNDTWAVSPMFQGTSDEKDSDIFPYLCHTGVIVLPGSGSNDRLGMDAGLFQPQDCDLVTIGDMVFNDCNHNGVMDCEEKGIAGVRIRLYACDIIPEDGILDLSAASHRRHCRGLFLEETVTDLNGNYEFSGLIPGEYCIEVCLPHGFRTVPRPNCPDVCNPVYETNTTGCMMFSACTKNLDIDFAVCHEGCDLPGIGDLVWNDANRDGLQTMNETGLKGIKATLYLCTADHNRPTACTDGALCDGIKIGSVTTGDDGKYLFSNLLPGHYFIRFAAPYGWVPTEKHVLDDRSVDSDVFTKVCGDNTYVTTWCINADEDRDPLVNRTIDAGFYFDPTLFASVGNFVWRDDDADGVMDPREVGVPGVTVQLYVSKCSCAGRTDDFTVESGSYTCSHGDGKLVATTMTDENGYYSFETIEPGHYYLKIVPPSCFLLTQYRRAGVPYDENSDFWPKTGTTRCLNLDANDNITCIDAGLIPKDPEAGMVGNFVWNDANKNGVQDCGEKGICGITVELHKCDGGALVATEVTDENGMYLFTNVPANTTYYVKFILPAQYQFTAQNADANDALDSDPCPEKWITANFTLGPGQNNMTLDAGMYTASCTFGNYVWNDKNNNGKKDNDEPGMADVTVELHKCGESTAIKSVKTDAEGFYTFSDILADSYYLKIIIPEGYVLGKSEESSDSGVNVGLALEGTCFDLNRETALKPVPLITSVGGVNSRTGVPTEFALRQNFPNPFNPSTTINFDIPAAGQYVMKVYNMLGQEVSTLINGELNAGYHSVTFDASRLTSGVYIYRLTGNNVVMTKKMMLNK